MFRSRPWTTHYEPGIPVSLPPVEAPFHTGLEAAAATAPSFPALSYYGSTASYAEVDATACSVAAALMRDGLELGDPVLVVLPHSPQLVAACIGVLRAGGVVAPVSPTTPDQTLEHVAATAGPKVAIAGPRAAAVLRAALLFDDTRVVVARASDSLPSLVRLIARLRLRREEPKGRRLDGTVGWSQWLKGARFDSGPTVGPDAGALLLDAAGDGPPTLFAHRHLVAGAAQLRAWLTDALPGEDTWLQLAPLWSSLGFAALLGTAVVLRSRVVLLPRWDATDILDALRYLRPSYVVADRAASAAVADDPRLARADLRFVRAWLTNEPLSTETVRAFGELADFSVCQGYGPKEAAGLATCNPVNGRRAPGSIGLPLPGIDIRLRGQDGEPATGQATGRLELSGPNVAGADWLRTDMVVRVDESGFVYPVTE